MELNEKYEVLKKEISKLNKVAVAFSGGVDSSFLSKVAFDVLGDNAIAVTIVSPMLPESELKDAKDVSDFIGIKHILVKDDNIEEEVVNNPKDRCYYCKKVEFGEVKKAAAELGYNIVLDGSNFDDLSDYRPGFKAVEELKVVSPLKIAELTKKDIRALSKELGLKTFSKPAMACLASRIPYGQKITKEKLKKVERAEEFLKQKGFVQIRVRNHENIARIEIEPSERERMFNTDLMDEISNELKSYGFIFVALELSGYKLGNMNREIKN